MSGISLGAGAAAKAVPHAASVSRRDAFRSNMECDLFRSEGLNMKNPQSGGRARSNRILPKAEAHGKPGPAEGLRIGIGQSPTFSRDGANREIVQNRRQDLFRETFLGRCSSNDVSSRLSREPWPNFRA